MHRATLCAAKFQQAQSICFNAPNNGFGAFDVTLDSSWRNPSLLCKERPIEERRRSLLTGWRLRRSNAELATTVAELSDLLAPTIALTTLRGISNGIDVEGRGTNLGDVRVSLARLQAKLGAPAAFDLRREEGSQDVVSFHLEIEAK